MTLMPLKSQVLVLDTVAAHNGLLAAVASTFHFFEGAVSGAEATDDVSAKLAEAELGLSEFRGLHETLLREWAGYRHIIADAYASFGLSIASLSADEQLRLRDGVLRTAAGAHMRIRDRARSHMTRTLEGIRD